MQQLLFKFVIYLPSKILGRLIFNHITIRKWQWNLMAFIMFGAGISFSLFFLTDKLHIPSLFAATSPWSQTDWSGGTASGTVDSVVTTYESESNINTTIAGQISLDQTANWEDDLSSWSKRKSVTVSNSGSLQSNYQVKISITYDADMQTDFDDLRFTNSSGSILDHWIQSKTDSTSAIAWVEVDTLAGSGDTSIYMYYGNSSATSTSSGSNTFQFFDDFSSGSIDSTKWDELGGTGNVTINSNELQVGEGTNNWNRVLATDSTFPRSDLSVDMKYRWTSANASYDAMMMGWHDNSSGSSYTDMLYGYYHAGDGTCTTSCSAYVYEDGNNRTPVAGSWTRNTQYLIRVRVKSGGGAYYEQSTDDGENWTTSYNSSYSTESGFRVGYALHSGVHMFDDVRVRKWMTTEPSTAFGDEENKYSSVGILTSNIFDAGYAADWGTLSYTSSGAGTVTVKVRSSNSSSMSGATDWASCNSRTTNSDLSNGCVTDTHRYLQYQVTLAPSGSSSPSFTDISVAFTASDQTRPPINATSISITNVTSGNWTNTEPTITWTAGADNDGGGGLAGYCIALNEATIGSSSSLDPESTSGKLTGIDDGITNNSTCPYIVSGTSINLSSVSGLSLTSNKQYYFSIKAVDTAGNVYTGASNSYQDLVSFKYDSTTPTNIAYISMPSGSFSNVDDMSFSWPISGSSAALDSESGLLGYQYQINSTAGAWKGTSTSVACGINYIPAATSSYDLTSAEDSSSIVIGNNVVYMRTVDISCNVSTSATYRTGSIAYGGAAPTFDGDAIVTISPSTSTSNLFALSWPDANPAAGRTIEKYYYMINTSPPSSYSTVTGNTSTYIDNDTNTSVSEASLSGVHKGSNTVYVVAVDDQDNYSSSNVITGTFTLNSNLPDSPENFSISDASIKSASLWRASLAWSAPAYKGTGSLTYKIQRSTDGSTWTNVTTTTGLAYVDTVESSTKYYWRIGAYDTNSESISAPSFTNAITLTPKGTYSEAASLSSGPTTTNISTKKAKITWSTSRSSDSKIQYGITSGIYFTEEPSNSSQTTDHSINLNNLSPGTTYYYKAKWTDEDGNTGISAEKSFTTAAAPIAKDVSVSNIGLSSALINFTITNASSVKIYYGLSSSFGGTTSVSTSTDESTYTVQLSGLSDGTKYYYKINGIDADSNEYEGTTLDFTTLPRPQVTNIRIQEIKGSSQPAILITWASNTEISSIVSYYPENDPTQVADELNASLKKGDHKMVITNLNPQTTYILQVRGRDKIGNEAQSDLQQFTTATDTRPPQIIDIKIEGTSSRNSPNEEATTQLIVAWTTDEASTSQIEYGDGTGLTYSQKTQENANLVTNHVVIISNLTPSKVYHLRTISKDPAGNIGYSIDNVTITPKAINSALDLVIGNLSEVFGFLRNLQ